jgi:hypothetical protein
VAVIEGALERGEQGGSNGANLVVIGCVLAVLWWVFYKVKKIKKYDELIKELSRSRWQWSDGSDFGSVGKKRARRFEWC